MASSSKKVIYAALIGLILGATAIWRAYEIKGLLEGESALPHVVEEIRRMVILIPADRW